METTHLIRHHSIQRRRLEKLLTAEHKLMQIEASAEGKNFLFYNTEEKSKWWEDYNRKVTKCKAEIESIKSKYINHSNL